MIAFAAINSAVNAIDDAVKNATSSVSAGPVAVRSAPQRVKRQEHHLIHQGILVTNQWSPSSWK